MRLFLNDLVFAPTAASAEADPCNHGIACIEQLVKLMSEGVERLGEVLEGASKFGGAVPDTGVNCLCGIHIFHVGRGEREKEVRPMVEQPIHIDVPHKLHVLLRHGLLLEPGGFEGLLLVEESANFDHLPVPQQVDETKWLLDGHAGVLAFAPLPP
jgi:hypothetical protein